MTLDTKRLIGLVVAGLGLFLWLVSGQGLVGFGLTIVGLAVAFAPRGGYVAAFGRGSMALVAVLLFVGAAITMIVGGLVGLVVGITMFASGVWLVKTRRLLA